MISCAANAGRTLNEDCPINWDSPINAGLQSFWDMRHGTASYGQPSIRDLASNKRVGVRGVLTNGPIWSGYGPPCTGAGSVKFDGSNDNILGTLTAAPTTWTAAAWFFRLTNPSFGAYFSFGNGLSFIKYNSSSIGTGINTFSSDCYGVAQATMDALFPVQTWGHIIVTFVSGSVTSTKFWFNGNPMSMSQLTGSPGAGNTTTSFRLAGHQTSNNHMNGFAAECRMYNIAFTDAQASALYQDSLKGSPESLNWIRSRVRFDSVVAASVAATTFDRSITFDSGLVLGGSVF